MTLPVAERSARGNTLQNDFETLCATNGTPNGAALITSPVSASDGDSFYFSPGAVAIARGLIQHFSGEPCLVPVASQREDCRSATSQRQSSGRRE